MTIVADALRLQEGDLFMHRGFLRPLTLWTDSGARVHEHNAGSAPEYRPDSSMRLGNLQPHALSHPQYAVHSEFGLLAPSRLFNGLIVPLSLLSRGPS